MPVVRNPYALGVLSLLGGYSGADRIYLRAFWSGGAKLLLFAAFLGASFAPAEPQDLPRRLKLQALLAVALAAWYFADLLLVYNGLASSDPQIFGAREVFMQAHDPGRLNLFSAVGLAVIVTLVVYLWGS